MRVIVSSIDRVLFSGEARSVHLPGSEGEMTILPHHSPLITTLVAGEVRVSEGETVQIFPITSGLLEVAHDIATVLISA